MKENNRELISAATREKLCHVYSNLPEDKELLVDRIRDEILSNISQYARMTDFNEPVKKVEKLFLKRATGYSDNNQQVLKRAIMAKLALHLPAIVNKMNLPESITSLYPDAFGRFAEFLINTCNEPYDSTNDFFRKDICFVLGISIPCGAQVVDLYSRFRLPTVIISFLRSRDLNSISRYLFIKGYRPWFQIHTESRYLNDFNEEGWESCYLRIAELLDRKPNITGMVGTSWFYDPKLLSISSHLSYLQNFPLDHGAFRLRHGTQTSDIANAIKASETRRQLYQEGKYIPVCYSMLWPRDKLIAWAKQVTTPSTHD